MNDETITKPILRYFYSHVTSAMHKNLSADLVSTLAGLQMNDFTHFYAQENTLTLYNNTRPHESTSTQQLPAPVLVVPIASCCRAPWAGYRPPATTHKALNISLRLLYPQIVPNSCPTCPSKVSIGKLS